MSQPRRDWSRIQTDRFTECRICGSSGATERAHITGRTYDERDGSVRRVDPDSILPLCGPATDSRSCHGLYDAGNLDVLPHLTRAEQVRAVKDLGIEGARMRTAPSAYESKVAR